jgi:hypothetical protein
VLGSKISIHRVTERHLFATTPIVVLGHTEPERVNLSPDVGLQRELENSQIYCRGSECFEYNYQTLYK